MAKKKKVVQKEVMDSIDEVEKITETLETLPVIESKEDSVSEFEEVIGVTSAESLQKAGRQLIAVSFVNGQKVYKFKR